MTTSESARRSPVASAAILVAVLLLFGAVTFVAGLAIGGGDGGIGQADASAIRLRGVPPTRRHPARRRSSRRSPAPSRSEAFAALCETYAEIKGEYVDEITDEELVDGAVRGMVEYGLEDPYSGYLTPEPVRVGARRPVRRVQRHRRRGRDGEPRRPDDLESCTVVTDNCAMVIVAPLEGSPAEEAGPAAGRPDARDRRRPDHRRVGQLARVRRPRRGRHRRDAHHPARRREIGHHDHPRGHRPPGGHLRAARGRHRLRAADDSSPIARPDMVARRDRRTSSTRAPTTFVFDLRGNPGGYIVAAQQIASEFVAIGRAAVHGRVGRGRPGVARRRTACSRIRRRSGRRARRRRLRVGLGDRGRGAPGARARQIVGEPTFGKNTVQVWNDLPNGGGLRLTTDRWFTPDHNSVAPDGVQPDVVVASPEDPQSGEDPQLDRALELLAEG